MLRAATSARVAVDWNRFEWWGEYPRQLGFRGDIAVLGCQSDVFRSEYPGPTFWTPSILTVPVDTCRTRAAKPIAPTFQIDTAPNRLQRRAFELLQAIAV
jgi:hypothetical protein